MSNVILDIPAVNDTSKPFSLSLIVMRGFVGLSTFDYTTGQSTHLTLTHEEWDKVLEYSKNRKELFEKELNELKSSD